MPGGTIWKGNIHFGDVDVPVKLHSSVREERVRFHLLHEGCHTRLHQQMICAYDRKAVPTEEQARGFELEDGKFIIVGPDELEQAASENSRVIDVHEFVRSSQIDPLFLDRVYNLEPDVQSTGYRALVEALNDMDMNGICTWTMRKRSYLGALQAHGKILRLTTMRHADEVVSTASFDLQAVPVSEKELKIGTELIEHLTVPFDPGKFEDEHEIKLRQMIEKKVRGEKIAILKPRQLKPTQPDHLLQMLEASLKKAA